MGVTISDQFNVKRRCFTWANASHRSGEVVQQGIRMRRRYRDGQITNNLINAGVDKGGGEAVSG